MCIHESLIRSGFLALALASSVCVHALANTDHEPATGETVDAESVLPGEQPGAPPTPTPVLGEEPTPTVTPTPISKEEFESRLSRWCLVDFIQIGDFKEATLKDLYSGQLWRVQEGDTVLDLRVISISADRIEVDIGGYTGELLPVEKTGQCVILEDGFGSHTWSQDAGAPIVLRERAFRGQVCFRPTGNNRLSVSLLTSGKIGDGASDYVRLNIAVMLLSPNADLLVQVRGTKQSWVRWGFDAEKAYRGGFPWDVRGSATGLAPNRWHYFSIHLVDDLGFSVGDRVVELAFSARGKNVLFDSVSLSQRMPPGAKPVRMAR